MRKIFLSLTMLLSAVLAFGQASTEGKDFYVALTLCAAPSSGLPEPFIAISTKSLTTIRITNPNDPTWGGVTRQVTANQWVELTTDDIPLAQWYPTSANSIANAKPQSGQTHNYGLHIVTDKEVSVFAALRMTNSFDAANILPTHVLQSEYYTQDYPPYIKPSDGEALSMFTILATENNTVVNITPKTTTADNHAAGQTYSVTLNAGQTYYVISQTLTSLSGTHVVAQDGKKIAIFQGDIFTQIPGGKAARDCTYEQAMPVDYWGRQFVVTRSLQKDANRIRVTAMENGTQLHIDGILRATIDAGDTYEFELRNSTMAQSAQNPSSANINEDAVFLDASCPVAVYSYDVSNGYKAATSEMVDDRGDPSMVWISPIEQKINDITFGVCGTNKTKRHFIDIVCLTTDASLTTLTSAQRPNGVPLTFQTVNGNPLYSYARVFLVDDDSGLGEKVFHLANPHGIIAHIYGNGDDESYAYSVGSAAVKRGVSIDGIVFVDGYRDDGKLCLNRTLSFDAQVGTDIIDKVDWDFGDGVTLLNGPVQTSHTYEAAGWYDVVATIYAHKECPETSYPPEACTFSFRVVRPDTVRRNYYICDGESLNLNGQIFNTATRDTAYFDCDSVVIFNLEVGNRSFAEFDTIAHDEFRLGSRTYYESGTYSDTLVNAAHCDSIVTAHVTIIQCLNMTVNNPSTPICGDQGEVFIPYSVTRGEAGDAEWITGSLHIELEPNSTNNGWYLPLDELRPGRYSSAYIEVQDPNCGGKNTFNMPLEILYPSSIFAQKWEDVLAVLNKKYNGGYDIIAYQWYLDGQPIEGATSSIYYVGPDNTLVDGGSYSVSLTTIDGMVLMSCPKEVSISSEASAPADNVKRAVLVAPGVLMIEVDGRQYMIR